MTVIHGLSMRSCNCNFSDRNQPILDLIIQGQVLDMTRIEMSYDFVWGQSVAATFRFKLFFSHVGAIFAQLVQEVDPT